MQYIQTLLDFASGLGNQGCCSLARHGSCRQSTWFGKENASGLGLRFDVSLAIVLVRVAHRTEILAGLIPVIKSLDNGIHEIQGMTSIT